jgi:Rrf2 family protein
MKISAKAEYACLAILALARRGTEAPPLRIREISEAYEIPERYLVQILLQLKGAGLVASTRGAAGGYRLTRDPQNVRLSEILLAIDGPDSIQPDRGNASRQACRVLESVWASVRAAERAVLDRTTIASLVEQTSPHEWTI